MYIHGMILESWEGEILPVLCAHNFQAHLAFGVKSFFRPCKPGSKYTVTCHARNVLNKYRGSPLAFCPPLPPKMSAIPIIRLKIQEICA